MKDKLSDSNENKEVFQEIDLGISKDILLREKQFSQEFRLKIFQTIVTAVVATLVPTIVSWQIQKQTVEIERLKNEQVYLNDFADQALQDDIAKRFNFANYLATVAHSAESRERWNRFSKQIQEVLTGERKLQESVQDLKNQRNELVNQIQSSDSLEKNVQLQQELDKLSDHISNRVQELRILRRQNLLVGNPNSIITLSGEIFSEKDRFLVRNLSIEDQGNAVWIRSGGTLSATIEINHNCPKCGSAINQIIVGMAGENKAQACVWSGLQTSEGWKLAPFVLTVPNNPGTYFVRVRYAQAYNCQDALNWWKVNRPNGPTSESNIGVVIVTK